MRTKPGENAQAILDAYRRTGGYSAAAQELGCTRQHVYATVQRWPEEAAGTKPKGKVTVGKVEIVRGTDGKALVVRGPEGMVASLEAAQAALERARSVPETKKVRDAAAAMASYAKAQGLSRELIVAAGKVEVLATLKLARILAASEKNPGVRMAGGVKKAPPEIPTLLQLGISKADAKIIRGIGKVEVENPDLFERVLSCELSMPKAIRLHNGTAKANSNGKPEADPQLTPMVRAHAALTWVSGFEIFADEPEVMKGLKTELKKLEARLNKVMQRSQPHAAYRLLSEAAHHYPAVTKLVEFARSRLRQIAKEGE